MTGNYVPGVAAPVVRLIEAFRRLPGIGPKSAQRLTYHLIRMPRDDAEALADSILAVKDRIIICEVCQNITESSPCPTCTDEGRDRSSVCVVEEPLDALAIERTRAYNGLYHVLHGVISPVNGVSADDLKVRELLERLRDETITEVILGMNPNLEGEATAMYLQRLIGPLGLRITRLARGLSTGADLEYADDATLAHALEGRADVNPPPSST